MMQFFWTIASNTTSMDGISGLGFDLETDFFSIYLSSKQRFDRQTPSLAIVNNAGQST